MREIVMPDVKFPDIRLPEGLRDMTREDLVQAAHDVRLPTMDDIRNFEMPDIDLPKVDFSKIELPKSISDHLPGRRRTNRLVPIAGLVAIGAAIAGVWWLVTSSVTGPRVRSAVSDLKQRMTAQPEVLDSEGGEGLRSVSTEAGEGSAAADPEAKAS